MDEAVTTVHNSLISISDSDFNATDAPAAVRALQQENILDFLSSWNTSHPDKHIVALIAEKGNALNDKANNQHVHTNVLTPLVNTLINKAKSVQSSLDEASKTAINDAISNVENKLPRNTDNTINTDLSAAFDTLYALTRKAEMANLRNDIIRRYGDIDGDIFNTQLFVDEVNTDLEAEQITESTNISIDAEEAAEVVAPGGNNTTPTVTVTGAKKNGQDLVSETDQTSIQNKINSVTADNAYEFLSGYYENGGSDLFSKLTSKLSANKCKEFINKIVEAGKDMSLTDKATALENALNTYTTNKTGPNKTAVNTALKDLYEAMKNNIQA